MPVAYLGKYAGAVTRRLSDAHGRIFYFVVSTHVFKRMASMLSIEDRKLGNSKEG